MNKFIFIKAIFLILLLVNSKGSWSQGNLQFSQVINLTPGNTYTVPANKVLKIESLTTQSVSINTPLQSSNCPNGNCTCVYTLQPYLNIESLTYSAQPANLSVLYTCPATNSASVTLPNIVFPIWLNAGKQITIQNNVTGILLTAIEFNIIP
jgi:hypothetical protein